MVSVKENRENIFGGRRGAPPIYSGGRGVVHCCLLLKSHLRRINKSVPSERYDRPPRSLGLETVAPRPPPPPLPPPPPPLASSTPPPPCTPSAAPACDTASTAARDPRWSPGRPPRRPAPSSSPSRPLLLAVPRRPRRLLAPTAALSGSSPPPGRKVPSSDVPPITSESLRQPPITSDNLRVCLRRPPPPPSPSRARPRESAVRTPGERSSKPPPQFIRHRFKRPPLDVGAHREAPGGGVPDPLIRRPSAFASAEAARASSSGPEPKPARRLPLQRPVHRGGLRHARRRRRRRRRRTSSS